MDMKIGTLRFALRFGGVPAEILVCHETRSSVWSLLRNMRLQAGRSSSLWHLWSLKLLLSMKVDQLGLFVRLNLYIINIRYNSYLFID